VNVNSVGIDGYRESLTLVFALVVTHRFGTQQKGTINMADPGKQPTPTTLYP